MEKYSTSVISALAIFFSAFFTSIEAKAQAAFTSANTCLGNATKFTDASVSLPGDPIVAWNWSFPGGNPASSNQQNPVTVYSLAATYTVTLVITTLQGNKDTVLQQVSVYSIPVVAFSTSITGNVVQFNDQSTSAYGTIGSWNWSFSGGTPSASTVQNPSTTYAGNGTYTVCLTVSNEECINFSCQTISINSAAVNEIELFSSLVIFPNPTSGNVFVDFGKKDFGKTEIVFRDVVGRILYSTNISASGKQSLDISGFSKGIYFLNVKTMNNPDNYRDATKKIVIEK